MKFKSFKSTNKGEIHSDVSLDVVVDAEGVVVDVVVVVEVVPLLPLRYDYLCHYF